MTRNNEDEDNHLLPPAHNIDDLSQAVETQDARNVVNDGDDEYQESLGATAMTFAGAFVEPAIIPDETGDL